MSDTPTPKHPHLEKLGKTLLDLIAAAAREADALKDAEKPVEALRNLTRAMDRIAARVEKETTLEAERIKPQAINPLVEITCINVCRQVTAAARDLAQQKGLPKAWEDFQKTVKESMDTAKAAHTILAQAGVAATVVLPGEPLKGEDGKPIVEG